MKVTLPLYLRISFLVLAVTNVLPSWFNVQIPKYAHWTIGALFVVCLLTYLVSVIRQRKISSSR